MNEAAGMGPEGTGPAGGGPARTGRRPGSSDTRARILAAARAAFGELGFEAATIRGVAARAGVDAALVHHYFGTKQQLFVAAMEIPADATTIISRALAGPPEELGLRIARFVLELWDSPEMHPLMLGIVRSAATDPVAAGMFRQVLAEGPFLAMARATDRPDADLRAALVGAQLVGLAMARYIVKVDPIASADREELARAIGPTLQLYLTGDLGGGEPPA
jgi:AcrR family transcriptional regulator